MAVACIMATVAAVASMMAVVATTSKLVLCSTTCITSPSVYCYLPWYGNYVAIGSALS
ncbi:hypothetical protein BJ165DRAFT_1502386 [Panaeolus papilionaceus]|nr:hypothetical protein BJ165DRAFT_1516001 [Panaeolus papilionaceus]KAF9037669.1 hypothetical protein BJ165DRAFT_1502386 [Panaeolus papilionaceus]